MQPFDSIHTPLSGTCLIEAGAGTGKTYTITTIVVRLILEEALPAEQILVVTFTTAATAELRDRIRRRLKDAQRILRGHAMADDILTTIVHRSGPRDAALERLEDALANFDRMPVYTIHGFCQRVLHEMAFETGSGFEAELLTDATAIIQQLTDDFWRKTWYVSPPELMAFALQVFKTPDDLAALYRRHAIPDVHILPAKTDLPPVSFEEFRARWEVIRRHWLSSRQDILSLLQSPDLKANIYGRTDRPDGRERATSKRDAKIQAWTRQIDRWLTASDSGYPLPEDLAYFCQTKLDASLKKGKNPIQHVFFEACDHLVEESLRLTSVMDQWLTIWQVHYFHHLGEELARFKREHQTLFFDDLLLMVRDALRENPHGALPRLLRSRYRAALIDEFQDTDAVQYEIFETLFNGNDQRLFLIGDPKQAIYSFRGADIFTYLQAAHNAAAGYTLTRNWRSLPGLVQAVNTLYRQCPDPFVWPEIAFHPSKAAKRPEEGSLPERLAVLAPLTIWFLENPRGENGRPQLNKKTASERICAGVAREVKRLARTPPADAQVPFRDIAILVRTNRQALMVKEHMAAAAIPAVIYNAGSVFHRPEALDLQRILDAVADPGDESKLRTALATPCFERQGHELVLGDPVPAWWDATLDRFFHYRSLWRDGGFMRMFRHLMAREKMAPRLVAAPSGERYLTNMLHLAELLHQAAVTRHMGIAELLQWLAVQRMQTFDPPESHQIRLESDDDAVTILTVHKSKGLEFPIVFCPFAWEGMGNPTPPALCHHAGKARRLVDLGSEDMERHLARMAEERMAEELRLLYVALTRAQNRCYMVWGDLPSAAYSAFAYLLDTGHVRERKGGFWEGLQTRAENFRHRSSSEHRMTVADVAGRSDGAIGVRDITEEAEVMIDHIQEAAPVGPPRVFSRKTMTTWRITSFSSLIHHRHEAVEIRDDLEREDEFSVSRQGDETDRPELSIGAISAFEASARAGLFFHDILEHIDFTASHHQWRETVDTCMQAHGFAPQWQDTILEAMQRVVQTPLEGAFPDSFCLRQVPLINRVNEMAFHLPLHAVDAGSLGQAFSACRQPDFAGRLPKLMEQLAFSISGGFLKGYIDLVFRHGGRYFVVDWKSNLLGDTFQAYHPRRLGEVMTADYYFLQYHLYTLALDQYLRSGCPGYSYEKDFGGVYYCFIRGMGSPNGSPTGVFYDRPASELIRDLRKSLLI